MVSLVFEIDQALQNLRLDPKTWVSKSIKGAPFNGSTPVVYLTRNGAKGTQVISRYLLKDGLKASISSA